VVRVRQEGYLTLEQAFNLTDDPSLRGPLVTLLLQPDPAKPPKPQPAAAPLSAREMAVPPEARKEFEKGYRELAERKHPELSVPHFQKAIELHRDYDEAYVQLALAFFEQRQRANALRTLSKAVEIYPQNARAFALLGKVLIDTNQVEPGIQALEEALALDETLWGAHADLGSALLYRKELDRALTHARRAFALNPQVPLTHVLLATVLQERKEYAEAVQVLDECLRQFPDGKLAAELRKQRDEARKRMRQP
jgi:tetratricopeptide (TPR) repeat protein